MVTDVGIGERLRNAREAKGLSLQAMEGITRIRAVYLQALEDEQFDRLPAPVYAKGFLRTYATSLGLDPEQLMEQYTGGVEAPIQSIVGVHPVEIPIRPAAQRSPLRRGATLAGIFLLAGVLVIGIFGYLQLRRFGEPVPPETVTPPPAVPESSAEPVKPNPRIPEPPPSETEPERPPPITPPPVGGINIEVRASDASWVRVIADGAAAFQGILAAGEVRTWRAERSLTIRVGNSEAVQVLVNGKVFQPTTPGRVWEETIEAPQ
jgi:cytoskeletal protein RodZ